MKIVAHSMEVVLLNGQRRRLNLPRIGRLEVGTPSTASGQFGNESFLISLRRVIGGWEVEKQLHTVRTGENTVKEIL